MCDDVYDLPIYFVNRNWRTKVNDICANLIILRQISNFTMYLLTMLQLEFRKFQSRHLGNTRWNIIFKLYMWRREW